VDHGDDELHYVVAGLTGQAVPLVLFPQDEGVLEKRRVSVFGRDNTVTIVDIPPYRLRNCGKQPLIMIEYRARANRPDEFDLTVRTIGADKSFVVGQYDWDFGDGQHESNRTPFTVHSYRNRGQEGVYSQYLVQVVVKGSHGERYRGRVALQLLNRAYQIKKQRGVVLIEAELLPRFAEIDSYGVARQKVRLFHHEKGLVAVERLMVEKQYVGTASESKLTPIDVEQVLHNTAIPPGEGITFELTLDTESEPDTAGLNYVLSGHMDSLVAQGAFSLLRPPKAPTKDEHLPVYEPSLKARIVEARRLLHREYVTDEDLWRLERDGAFRRPEFQPSEADRSRTGPPSGAALPYRDGRQVTLTPHASDTSTTAVPAPNPIAPPELSRAGTTSTKQRN
jgi:hypothetical protein